MAGLPQGEVDLRIAAVQFLPLVDQVGAGGAQAVVNQLGGHGMVVGLAAITDHLDLLLNKPLGQLAGSAAAVSKVVVGVGPDVVLIGVDHDDVAFLDDIVELLQILGLDLAPLALGDVQANAGAEEAPQGVLADVGGQLGNMQGGVHMGAAVHDALPLDVIHAVVGVEADDFLLQVATGGPLRHKRLKSMRQVKNLNTHVVTLLSFD